MKYLSVLIKGILAGICISIGGFICLKANVAANSSEKEFILCNAGFSSQTYLYNYFQKISINNLNRLTK